MNLIASPRYFVDSVRWAKIEKISWSFKINHRFHPITSTQSITSGMLGIEDLFSVHYPEIAFEWEERGEVVGGVAVA